MGKPGHQRDLASHGAAAVAQRVCAPLVTDVFPTVRIKLARKREELATLRSSYFLFATKLHRKFPDYDC